MRNIITLLMVLAISITMQGQVDPTGEYEYAQAYSRDTTTGKYVENNGFSGANISIEMTYLNGKEDIIRLVRRLERPTTHDLYINAQSMSKVIDNETRTYYYAHDIFGDTQVSIVREGDTLAIQFKYRDGEFQSMVIYKAC